MKKLYNEYFYVPEHGKIRDKVMLTRVFVTVAITVICLAAMSITAYAYFSHDVTSSYNTIKSANFDANVSITLNDQNKTPVAVTRDGKIQTATLNAGSYTIRITKGTSTSKTGFCIITLGDTKYYTQQIGVDVSRKLTDGSASVEFTLKVPSGTSIKILSHWGTSKYYGYKDEGRSEIFIDSYGFNLDLTNGKGDKSETNTENLQETTTLPSTDKKDPIGGAESSATATETTTPAVTTTPETTGTSEPAATAEPGSTTVSSESSNAAEPVAAETKATAESTEPLPATQPDGTTSVTSSEGNS